LICTALLATSCTEVAVGPAQISVGILSSGGSATNSCTGIDALFTAEYASTGSPIGSVTTIPDATGNGNTATVVSGALTVSTVTPTPNGTQTFAPVAALATFTGLPTPTSFTIVAVYRLTATGGGQTILGSNNVAGGPIYYASESSYSGHPQGLTKQFVTDVAEGTAASTTNWVETAVSSVAGSSVQFYIDGAVDTLQPHSISTTYSNGFGALFSSASGGSEQIYAVLAEIDFVSASSGSAGSLSGSQISAIHACHVSRYGAV
jgi:hypothetical protein